MQVHYSANTHVGLQRQINQDAYGVGDLSRVGQVGYLLVVCDGMGGHTAGEIASHLGVETILNYYYSSGQTNRVNSLEESFQEANQRIYRQGRGQMGTTGVAALFLGNYLHVANVGDSRAYLVRSGKIRQISHDHSLVSEQVAAGILTPEQARHSSYRNMITRALGHRDEVQVDTFSEPVQVGDTIVLSTDGMHGLIEDEEIAQAVNSMSPEEVVKHLIALANNRGGIDNITVVVAQVTALDTNASEAAEGHEAITEPLPTVGTSSATHTSRSTAQIHPQVQPQGRSQERGGGCWRMAVALLITIALGGGALYGAQAAGVDIPFLTPPTATITAMAPGTATVMGSPTITTTATLAMTSTLTTTATRTPFPSRTATTTATLSPTP